MNLPREYVARLSADTGFLPNTLEKVIRLGSLLADVTRHPLLSRVLVLKGGTALNLFFGAPSRLSVDLDFNYVGSVDRARMLEERPDVERAIQTIAHAQGYRVQRSAEEHAGRKLYMSYRSSTNNPERIEVDLNYLYRLPLGEPQMLSMWQPGDLERPRARVVALPELYAGKLCALLDRVMPRDLFDAALLPDYEAGPWPSRIGRKVFVALSATLDHPLHTYGRDRLERATDRMIREQLEPMLSLEARTRTGALQMRAWSVLEPLLLLEEAEREYIDRIHTGELRPELLFPEDPDLIAQLHQHPALAWKIENVRRISSKKMPQ